MKAEGIGDVNPGHPDLLLLLRDGAEIQGFVGAARTAVGKHKGFAYALGIVRSQLTEAKTLADGARAAAAPVNGHSGSKARAARMAEARGSSRPPQGDYIDTEATDVTPRRLG